MKHLPRTNHPLVVRADFSDDDAWKLICELISEKQEDDFQAQVEFLNDYAFESVVPSQLDSIAIATSGHHFVFIVDHITFGSSDHPILVVAAIDEPARLFRVVPSEMWAVENNLSLANMDFHEFADAVDEDGVFRGFPEF